MRLRDRAETMAASAEAMKKIADAADPLYKTLDDGQKRRLAILTHHGRFGGEGGGWRHRWMERGFERDHWQGRDGDGQTGRAALRPIALQRSKPREAAGIQRLFALGSDRQALRKTAVPLLDIGRALC